MKPIFDIKTFLAIGAAFLLGTSNSAAAPLRILAATNDLAAIARAVTGPSAEIKVVARPDRDLHSLEVRPSMMTMAAKANVYLAVGLSLDLWSEGIVQGSRNAKLGVITCSEAVQPLEIPTGKVDASMGDVHPYGNPHYWLDPENAVLIARDLAKRFTALDAAQRNAYQTNAEAFAKQIEERISAWKERMQGLSFVEYHRTWIYAAKRFDMEIAGQVEPLPGIPPTAQHLASLSATIREKQTPVVIRDLFHPDGPVEFLQRETGVRAAVVPASCAEPTPESYLQIFDRLANALSGKSKT
jgi:zinc/manganese transport system substrate-binding protein